MAIPTLLDFATDKMLIHLLVKERAKCRRKNRSETHHSLDIVGFVLPREKNWQTEPSIQVRMPRKHSCSRLVVTRNFRSKARPSTTLMSNKPSSRSSEKGSYQITWRLNLPICFPSSRIPSRKPMAHSVLPVVHYQCIPNSKTRSFRH